MHRNGARFIFRQRLAGLSFRKIVVKPKYLAFTVDVYLVLFGAFSDITLKTRETNDPRRRRDIDAEQLLVMFAAGGLPDEPVDLPRLSLDSAQYSPGCVELDSTLRKRCARYANCLIAI